MGGFYSGPFMGIEPIFLSCRRRPYFQLDDQGLTNHGFCLIPIQIIIFAVVILSEDIIQRPVQLDDHSRLYKGRVGGI